MNVMLDGGPLHGATVDVHPEATAFLVEQRRGLPADESSRPQLARRVGRYEVLGGLGVWRGWRPWALAPEVLQPS